MKKIVIVGAGPGGLAAGLLLASKGYDVHIYEKDDTVGGRNKALKLGAFTFDVGPTFLLYTDILKQVFHEANLSMEDYLTLLPIDPLYDLVYKDKTFTPSNDPSKTIKAIEQTFPGNEEGYLRFMRDQEILFNRVSPMMMKPFLNTKALLSKDVLTNGPFIYPFKTIYTLLKSYFKDEELIYGMSFQAKYLGMSAWKAPALFTMLSYLEHKYGIFHVKGGLNQINHAFKKAIESYKGSIHLNQAVKEIVIENKVTKGIKLSDDHFIKADAVVINADFAYSYKHLIPDKDKHLILKKPIEHYKFSLSTYMIYLALDKKFPLKHHTIFFAENYEKNVKDITENLTLTDDFSFYVQNPSQIDDTLAPPNQSALYILVPVPNLDAEIDWHKEKNAFKEKVLDKLEAKIDYSIRSHIIEEKIITPNDWEKDFNVYKGAVFNLSHQLSQMLTRRPKNKIKAIDGLYLVGGGTHPGSGLPTIYQSALITSALINKAK
ncbi:MAG: phytoene desaturase family protein [Candidatus Izemoplasmataceae bacterium]